jgi:hypothetical protein
VGKKQQPSKLKVAGSNPAGVANKIRNFSPYDHQKNYLGITPGIAAAPPSRANGSVALRHGSDVGGRQKTANRPPLPAALVRRETDACFIVRDANEHALAYVYFEDERGGES